MSPIPPTGLIAETLEFSDDRSWVVFNLRERSTPFMMARHHRRGVAFSYENCCASRAIQTIAPCFKRLGGSIVLGEHASGLCFSGR